MVPLCNVKKILQYKQALNGFFVVIVLYNSIIAQMFLFFLLHKQYNNINITINNPLYFKVAFKNLKDTVAKTDKIKYTIKEQVPADRK